MYGNNRVFDPMETRGEIRYKGKPLGVISLCTGGFNLTMTKIEQLVTLINLKPEDELDVDGKKVPYKHFHEDILKEVKSIYSSSEAFVSTQIKDPMNYDH